jgi:hypothetical protein
MRFSSNIVVESQDARRTDIPPIARQRDKVCIINILGKIDWINLLSLTNTEFRQQPLAGNPRGWRHEEINGTLAFSDS